MSAASKAVFLSYASQDAEAARRICESLRAAGVEVWFDQSELVGGDAWDAKIRGQIASCALFVPVISANTQARREGYFRLEWKLADERTHLMAEGTPFVLPVVIDDTNDRAALVPKSFLVIQWTRLMGGETPPTFCARVKALLDGEKSGAERPVPSRAGSRSATPQKRRWLATAIASCVIIAALAIWHPWKKTAAISPDNSVAVLAFANLSDDRSNEYFSEGISEEVLNKLAAVPGMRVAARTSAFYFKGRNATAQDIGQKLGTAYIVDGTVRKSGTAVLIVAHLSRTDTGQEIWMEKFEGDLGQPWALQEKIAGRIAEALQLKLAATPQAARTINPEAYAFVLEGRYFWNQRADKPEEALAKAADAFQKAIVLDSGFAEAHAGLGDVWVSRGLYRSMDGRAATVRADYLRANEEARRALELNASLAEPHVTLAYVAYCEGRLRESEQHFARAFALNPNYALTYHWHALLLAAMGRIDEGIVGIERSLRMDPLSSNTLWSATAFNTYAHRLSTALAVSERAIGLRPGLMPIHGDRALILLTLGRKDEAVAAARTVARDSVSEPRWWADSEAIHVLRQCGLQAEAADYAQRLLADFRPDDYRRVLALAALGRGEEALQSIGTIPTIALSRLYWHPMWDPWRDDARFHQQLVKLGCAEEYKTARDTLARLLKQQKAAP